MSLNVEVGKRERGFLQRAKDGTPISQRERSVAELLTGGSGLYWAAASLEGNKGELE